MQTPRFFDDDPLAREPDTEDASGAAPGDVGLAYELSYNLFVTAARTPSNTRALNANTIDEVPDSSWYINRLPNQLPLADLVRGPNIGASPAPEKWSVIREKSSGFAPGFTARDARGETWFISFDPPSNPEGSTGALIVANRIFWALGYHQVESFLTEVDRNRVEIDPAATVRRPSGARTPFTRDDLNAVFERAAAGPRRVYRAVASRLLPGKILGPFRYQGTRPDDPNDIVPHEHRRELRALRVFGAWTNLTDLKAGNTLDTLVEEGGRAVVKHYVQDVGSTFGMGANGPHDWDEGWEYFYQGDTSLRRLLSFGFALSPWQTADYREFPSIGRFEGDRFDPITWRPHTPTRAYVELRADDAFWAARRVMAFSDEIIRALVETGEFTDAAAAEYLGDVLIKRRDAIGRAYIAPVNPIVDPVLDASSMLTFRNAAVDHGLAGPPGGYKAVWYTFDNLTGTTGLIGETSGQDRIQAPGRLPAGTSFVKVGLSATGAAQPAWAQPIDLYFRRAGDGWRLVGLDRHLAVPMGIDPAAN
jgi:hypothetical protein